MTALLYTLGVVIFFVSILVSIGLHELGHMIPAKLFGGKVTQYFIGFGPTVWSKRVGETEYGVKAIPLGGYVKIVGMLPPGAAELTEPAGFDDQGRPVQKLRKSNTGMFTQLISDARAAEWELVGPDDADRLFYKMPPWKKIVVMAGGPSVNILIAFGLFWTVFATFGNGNDIQATPAVAQISACVLPATADGQPCTVKDPLTPAYEGFVANRLFFGLTGAYLEPGDRFVSFNGTPISSWSQLQPLIRDNGDKAASIVVDRDGTQVPIALTTLVTPRPTSDTGTATAPVGFLGVSPESYLQTGGPLYTVRQMGDMAVETVKALGTLPVKVYGVGEAIVGAKQRDPNGPVSIVGGSRFAGEAVSSHQVDVSSKVAFLLSLIGGFNFFVGAFNFVPLLPLDGGHIASAAWEAVRRRLARLRGRPDPGFVDAAKLLPIAYVVASALLVMGVVLIVGDLVAPVTMPT